MDLAVIPIDEVDTIQDHREGRHQRGVSSSYQRLGALEGTGRPKYAKPKN